MMADSSQKTIFGRLMVGSCTLFGGCRVRFPDAQTVPHFGQAKGWAEDDWDAARSFCLLRLSLAASCLSASNLRLAFLIDESDLKQCRSS